MLLNAKAEELSKYSKLKYNADKFISKVKECWEYTDKQIRCVYLISDLAKRGHGVFSVAYSTFQTMFEQRFKMKISLSSVRRFFQLMEKLNLLSINEAKRKNNSQSANIYIIEQQCEEPRQIENGEHPPEDAGEDLNIISFQEIKDGEQKPLRKDIVNKKQVEQEQMIYKTYIEYKKQGIDRKLFNRVIAEVQSKTNIRNLKAYLRACLNKVVHHKSLKNGTKIFGNSLLSNFHEILMTEQLSKGCIMV
ncbi:hypothetical protein LRO89_02900 [Priestia megaterium]|uniref:hypothetical protein n=1 Tax=Priestia megaterium TaxID=1404 RepID=UPI0039C131CB